MQKLVSKYALAAHLAVMAVAPLFLLPFAGSGATATVLLWLSAFGFIWVFMEPSRRRGEMPHDARARVGNAVLRDPLFWFSLVLVVYAAIRALNSGIGLAYDAELMVWSLQEPALEFFPGCVAGAGRLAFATVVAVAVIFAGARHALGRSARGAFLLVGSLLSGIAAITLTFAMSYRHAASLALMKTVVTSASYFGTAFGIQLLAALVAVFTAVENKWMRAEPLAAIGLIGNAIGLVVFSPIPTILVFLVAFLLFVVASFVLMRHRLEGSGSLRCALAIMMAVAAPVLYVMATENVPEIAAKIAGIRGMKPFPDNFFQLREALSAIALKTWKANPWIGTGLGSFPLDIRFMATAEDWTIVSPMQCMTLNGWWLLLAERGVIGALMIAVALGMLLWMYVARLLSSFRSVSFSPEHLLGPIGLAALTALAFVDCSYLRPEVLLIAGALMACSDGALPERKASGDEVKES